MISRKSSAQVMLEYLVMAAIVIAAVIYGGPFLVNSIGARFKVMEDNAGDSVSENITQAAPEKCICNPTSNNPSSWPEISSECGANGKCGKLETMRQRTCYGCSETVQQGCGASSKCCEVPFPGDCGSVDKATRGAELCATREGGASDGRCLDKNGGVQGCLSSERAYTAACGDNAIKYTCEEDAACVPVCTSDTWGPSPDTTCQGVEFVQTGNCGDTRTALGIKQPDCPSQSSVACGQDILSNNECGPCPKGSGGIYCPEGEECTDNKCKPICHYEPVGIYMAAHYYSATHKGHTPACPGGYQTSSDGSWVSVAQTGNSTRHRQCGKLYKKVGSICNGDPCVRGMAAGGQTSVTFHMGKYSAATKRCNYTNDVVKTVPRDNSNDFNTVNWQCQSCGGLGCDDKNCTAGYSFIGDNSNYDSNRSVASWGN